MKLKLAWVEDPETKKPSVSLTNFCLSVLFLLVVGSLQVAGKIHDTGLSVEYFGLSCALYFGRKLNLNGKTYEATPEKDEEKA